MDKNVLKKFAIESRQELMEKVANKINRYFVDEEFNVNQNGEVYVLANEKHTLRLTKSEYENRQLLVKRIKEITLEQVIEEAAYTWFNRIIAIRYMEIHDYLPLTKDNQSLGVRVLSSKDNTPDPEIMKISNLINPDLDIEFNKEYYGTIQDNNKRFEYILLLVCKKLGKVIPQVFDGVTDYIDILIPDNLLNESGYITKLLNEVSEDNFNDVEIIGWLYQYYNQTEKDRVFNEKKAYKKNEIPYATQLFTPDWIVKYMVENSLGRFLQNKKQLKYCLDTTFIEKEPKDIKFIDPCCGSGHILIYAFELLYKIYEEKGYFKDEICKNILENNLYGLDIDNRAGQLSILSVLLKARTFSKNIFNEIENRQLNIFSFTESNTLSKDSLEFFSKNEKIYAETKYIIESFYNAKNIGSLLKVKKIDFDSIIKEIEKINEGEISIYELNSVNDINTKLLNIVFIAKILTTKYDVLVTNPPYMSYKGFNKELKEYIDSNYAETKYDLFSCFINIDLCKTDGCIAMVTPESWMYLTSYEKLREIIINKKYITSMLHLGNNAFDEGFGTTAFVISNNKDNKKTTFIDLRNGDSLNKNERLLNKEYDEYSIDITRFNDMTGKNFAYWCSENVFEIFKNNKIINDIASPRKGLVTMDNNRFLRLWFEVDIDNIRFKNENAETSKKASEKWYPLSKGGRYRKWYGNNEYLINWKNNGNELKQSITEKYNGGSYTKEIRSESFYFKPFITWTGLSNKSSFRMQEKGFLFDTSGPALFADNEKLPYILAMLNSKIATSFLKFISPTLSFLSGDIAVLPVKSEMFKDGDIPKLVNECIEIAKKDWNLSETSWGFKRPIITTTSEKTIKECIKKIKIVLENNKKMLLQKEESLNEIFIKLYGLTEELNANVDENTIALRKFDQVSLVKELISYYVGCIFGRYSLDNEGIVCGGKSFDKDKYKTFEVDIDNIIPITENNYFGDDIVSRFKKFIEIIYGKETLYENLEFIAETLGKKNGENSEETIRRYFTNDFYNDHVRMYQKRPIYWLFDSGKKNGFKCLIYMHRYNEGLVSKIRLDYLHRMQNTYEKELKEISDKMNNDVDLAGKRELSKRQADISAKLQETNEYDEKIAHIADQKIKIDLDDGVAVNYAKFSVKNPKTGKDESILAKIK